MSSVKAFIIKSLGITLIINVMCVRQVLHGLGVLDDLLHHQEPARAITFASPSFRTLFSVPDSIVCFVPLPFLCCLLCHLSLLAMCLVIHVWLISSYQLSGVLLNSALPRQSSALPIDQ